MLCLFYKQILLWQILYATITQRQRNIINVGSSMQSYKKIDAHCHIFPEKIREKAVAAIGDFYGIAMEGMGSVSHLLASGKTYNVQHYIVHSVATVPAQVASINSFIAQETAIHKELIGFATLHPHMDGLQEEVERVIALGLCGIKLHADFQEFDIDSEAAYRLYEAVGSRLPIMQHMGDEKKTFSKPERLARVLEDFPKQTFIGAHFGGYSAWDDAQKCLVGKNVYFDTSSALFSLSPKRAVEIIRAHGVDKILFGTDYPMWMYEDEIARFEALPLTEDEKQKIYYENAAKLLNL